MGFAFIKLVAQVSLKYGLILGSFDYSYSEYSSLQSFHAWQQWNMGLGTALTYEILLFWPVVLVQKNGQVMHRNWCLHI